VSDLCESFFQPFASRFLAVLVGLVLFFVVDFDGRGFGPTGRLGVILLLRMIARWLAHFLYTRKKKQYCL
jgi:hypothetical protein